MSETFKLGRGDWTCPVMAILTEKDLQYIAKLIHNDINYRTKRVADRSYTGNETAVYKATVLRDQIVKVLKGDE